VNTSVAEARPSSIDGFDSLGSGVAEGSVSPGVGDAFGDPETGAADGPGGEGIAADSVAADDA